MSAYQHSLRLVAKTRAVVNESGQPQWDLHCSSSWTQGVTEFHLIDPWEPENEKQCRWYLEKHLRKDPFAITKARQTEASLAQYGKDLWKQIPLGDLSAVRRQQVWREETKVPRLEITIVDETLPSNGLGDTFHRLHWEVLEDNRLWPEFNFVVTVRRLVSVDADAIYALGSVRSWPHAPSDARSTFNILLVVARDLSEDTDLDEEVSPTLASQILLEIGSQVSGVREGLDIQIEIVRPGTLQALEKCLLAHPPGYFQLAHFDTHGRVAKDRTTKTKQAYLLLDSAKPSGKLSPVRASTVGHLLAKRGVRLSTLNSCDSAKADCGDSANLAAVFVREGVHNVLAMSFHLLESAASRFLRVFYVALILKQYPFSVAVSSARAALRNNTSRHAMLNLSRHLHDWIVPVVYASSEDVMLLGDGSVAAEELQVEIAGVEQVTKVIGRAFDLLRFERALLEYGVVCLSGAAGVGKSAFIQTALETWSRTNFCDTIIVVNLVSLESCTSESLARHILGALVDGDTEEAIIAQVAEFKEEQELQRILISILRSRRSILIFDNLHFTHSGLSARYLASSLGDAEQKDIADFLAQMTIAPTNLASEDEVDIPVQLVLISRVSTAQDWDFHFKSITRKTRFELPSLKVSDAISLGMKILEQAGISTSPWKHQDIDILDQVVSSLKCNPLAMEIVIPILARNDWRGALDKLMPCQMSSFPDLLDIDQGGMIREMNFIWASFGEEITSTLKYLSLFWISGPFVSIYAQSAEQLKLCSDASTMRFPLHVCRDRGWISIDMESAHPHISEIHPLFTLFLRQVIVKEYESTVEHKRKQDDTNETQENIELPDSTSVEVGLNAASSSFSYLYRRGPSTFSSWPLAARELLSHCFKSIGTRQLYLFQAQIIPATDVEEMIPKFHAELQNVLWVASMCSDPKLKLPISIWPIDGFQSFLAVCRIFQSPTEAKLCISHFGALINALLKQNDGTPLAAEQLYFALWISQYIVHSLRSEATTVSRKEAGAYAKVAVDVAEASVAAYGLPEDENTQLQVSVAYRNRAFTLLDERNVDEADIYWEKMLAIDQKLFESPLDSSQTVQGRSMSGDFKSSDEKLTYFRQLFPDQNLDEERISRFDTNHRLADQPWVAAWYPLRKAWWASLKLSLQSTAQSGIEDNDGEQARILSELAKYHEQADKAQEEAGIRGLNKDHRWWPEAYDPVSFQKFIGPRNQLAVASEALERGDWGRVAESYHEMARNAERRIEFDEAVEFADALLGLYQGEEASDAGAAEISGMKTMLGRKKELLIEFSRLPALWAASDFEGALTLVKQFQENTKEFEHAPGVDESIDAIIADLQWRIERQKITGEQPSVATSDPVSSDGLDAYRRLVTRHGNDPRAATQYHKRIAAVSREFTQVDRSQAAQDFESAILHLDRLLEIVDEGGLDHLVSRAVLETERAHLLSRQDWSTTSAAAFAAAEAANFADSYVLLDRLDEIAARLGHLAPGACETVQKIRGYVQGTQIRAAQDAIVAATANGDWRRCIRLSDELLKDIEAGRFGRAEISDPSQMTAVLRRIRRDRAHSLAIVAEEDANWRDALAAADELCAQAREEGDPAEIEKCRIIRKRYFVKLHYQLYSETMEGFRFEETEEHLEKLFEIAREDEQFPERSSGKEIMITLDSLEWCKLCLENQKRQIREMGEEKGRESIMMARIMESIVRKLQ
ncbi:hypothetical protein MMC11_002351 [Xylographa trunciseda]|nr:hypothetical protein [Xylographa trunciseda]